jgi:heme/copper-type cytochrome/quinol oxidase subunit 2
MADRIHGEGRRLRRTVRWAGCGLVVSVVLALAPAVTTWAGEDPEAIPVKEFRMDVENWRWVPNTLRVTVGTKVVLRIKSYDATHRFDLKEWGLKVVLPQDETTTIEFVADKVGTFKFRCGRPCGDGCPKIRGKLIVAEAGADESG